MATQNSNEIVDYIKLIIPFITFFLGYTFNWAKEKRIRRHELAKELLNLSQMWYEQIRRFYETEASKNEEEVRRAHVAYLSSREILPKYILVFNSLNFDKSFWVFDLLKNRSHAELINVANNILHLLTGYYLPAIAPIQDYLIDLNLQPKQEFLGNKTDVSKCRMPGQPVLTELDILLQKMAHLVARI